MSDLRINAGYRHIDTLSDDELWALAVHDHRLNEHSLWECIGPDVGSYLSSSVYAHYEQATLNLAITHNKKQLGELLLDGLMYCIKQQTKNHYLDYHGGYTSEHAIHVGFEMIGEQKAQLNDIDVFPRVGK